MSTFYGFCFQNNFKIQPLLAFLNCHNPVPSLSSLRPMIPLLLLLPPYSIIHTEAWGIRKLLLSWASFLLKALQWLPSQTKSQMPTGPSLLWSPLPSALSVSLHSVCRLAKLVTWTFSNKPTIFILQELCNCFARCLIHFSDQ